MPWRAGLALVAASVLGFAAMTAWALEGQEVVEIVTVAAGTQGGEPRRTRVWIADEGAYSWIEAATPGRAWLLDVQREPRVEVWRGGMHLYFRAEPDATPEGHARIRRLLREKYGFADRFVGLLQDTSRSVAVRLSPLRSVPGSARDGHSAVDRAAARELQPVSSGTGR